MKNIKWYKHPMLWTIIIAILTATCVGLYLRWYHPEIRNKQNKTSEWISLPQDTIEPRVYSDTIYYPSPDMNTIWKDSLHVIQTDSAGNIIKEFILYYR